MVRKNKLKKGDKNITWENNQQIISEAYFELIKENNRPPTLGAIAKKTGISRQTVCEHIKTINVDTLSTKTPHRLLAERVIMQLAKNGDAASAKLLFQLLLGYNEKSSVDITDETNRIQMQINLTAENAPEPIQDNNYIGGGGDDGSSSSCQSPSSSI